MSEREIQRLYEDFDLRDELDDDQAKVLLKWGTGQVEGILGSNVGDPQDQLKELRRLMKRINRFVGTRNYDQSEEQHEKISMITESAEKMGFPLTPEQVQSALSPDGNPQEDLKGLLALFQKQALNAENLEAESVNEIQDAVEQVMPEELPPEESTTPSPEPRGIFGSFSRWLGMSSDTDESPENEKDKPE